MANSGSSTSVLSDACPPIVDSPKLLALEPRAPGEHLDVPRLVGRLHGEHLHHLAEVRVHLRDEAAGNDQRGHFVLDQIRHDLHDGILDIVGDCERRVPGHGGFRIPLRGHGLLINPRRIVRPHLDLVDEMKIELRGARFDHRAARGQSPAARRMFGDGVGIRDALGPDAPGVSPALRFGAAVENDGASAIRPRFRLPLETMAFRAAPGAQIDLQAGSGAGDDDRPRRVPPAAAHA